MDWHLFHGASEEDRVRSKALRLFPEPGNQSFEFGF